MLTPIQVDALKLLLEGKNKYGAPPSELALEMERMGFILISKEGSMTRIELTPSGRLLALVQ